MSYRYTRIAAYIGYITQAIVNNFSPLLFVTFSGQFGLNLEDLSLLITINFGVQILIDLTSTWFVKPLGIRRCCVLAHVMAALGLAMYGILPFVMNPFAGLVIANVFCAIGGGLDEVVISPVIEALPGDGKASAMAMLHSFYCWGQVGVVALSTLFFAVCGISHWNIVSILWAIVPAFDAVLFAFVPICELNEGGVDMPIRNMLKSKAFRLFLVIMICAGASELAMSQWASLFAEKGLNVSKTLGDLLGPCFFALLMGCVRLLFGIFGERMNLGRCIFASGVLCVVSYLVAVFAHNPIVALLGCAVCGLSVALMWPGTYSMASKKFPAGGNAMFSILALAGDIGCTSGPTIAGLVGDSAGDIKRGLLVAAVFPAILAVSVGIVSARGKNNRNMQ